MSQNPALVRSRAGVVIADALGGLLLFALSSIFSQMAQVDAAAGPFASLGFGVAAAVMAAAVAMRRLHPAWALGLAWASTLVHMSCGLDASLTQLGVLVVLASAAHFGSRTVLRLSGISVAAGTVLAVGYLLIIDSWLMQLFTSGLFLPNWLPYLVLAVLVGLTLVVPWLIGLLARTLRLGREGRERARASQAEARRASEIAELQAARTLLARDVHDIVGHSLAVIIAQAESVRFRDVSEPAGLDAVREAVATIADTARRSLGEVRHVLESTAPSAEPVPGRSSIHDRERERVNLDVGQLLDDVARSRPGMIVRRDDDVRVPNLEAHVALYRALQELLTNALRHGDSSQPLRVELSSRAEGIHVVVENSVLEDTAIEHGESEHPSPREGTGIDGARARLAAVGGTLTTSLEGSIFRATVHVPVGAGEGTP